MLDLDLTGLIAAEDDPVPQHERQLIDEFGARRMNGVPVARLLGHQEFYGLRFDLGSDTLVPRPETELLVDLALAFLSPAKAPRVLDLGTGTGCIPIALLHERTDLLAVAVDLSAGALAMAQRNAERHGVSDRLTLAQGSWFTPLDPETRFDLITSNPPYIAASVINELSPEVREHDPRLALDGGADGLDAYRQILDAAPGFLRPGGRVMLEIGFDQAEAVRLIAAQSGPHEVYVHQDLAGLDRVIVAHC